MRAPPMKQPTAAPAIAPAFDGVVPRVELEVVGELEFAGEPEFVGGLGCWDVFVEGLMGGVEVDSLEVVVAVGTGSSTRGIIVGGFGATSSTVVLYVNVFAGPGPYNIEVVLTVTFVSTVAVTLVLSRVGIPGFVSVMIGLAPVSVVVTGPRMGSRYSTTVVFIFTR
jgi:hypothetical protein